jgi:hypothetical protein
MGNFPEELGRSIVSLPDHLKQVSKHLLEAGPGAFVVKLMTGFSEAGGHSDSADGPTDIEDSESLKGSDAYLDHTGL